MFSQWTATLDLLEVLIGMEGWEFCRLDGSLTGDKRDAAVQEFKGNDDIRILLASLQQAVSPECASSSRRFALCHPPMYQSLSLQGPALKGGVRLC